MESLLRDWKIEFHSGIPVYRQIINRISAAIADGALKEGDQLPTIRTLREMLQINPNTVAKAYRELELRGMISSQRGSGCFVASPQQQTRLSAKEKKARMSELFSRMTAEARSHGIQLEELMKHIKQRKSHV